MSDSVVIAARSVEKAYISGQTRLVVLKDVDLDIADGEFISIQGESGCGKTTLLNVLAGLEYPDKGYVEWNGEKVSVYDRNRIGRKRSAHLGIVFQSYHLVAELNSLQNILLNLRIAEGKIRNQSVERARELLRKVGLGERERQLPSTLSGGERQRIAIARALVTRPRVILADEPTGNLDEKTGEVVMQLLQQICRETNTALVLVTHNPEHAARADRRLELSGGSLRPHTV